jgi:hypothetical protein
MDYHGGPKPDASGSVCVKWGFVRDSDDSQREQAWQLVWGWGRSGKAAPFAAAALRRNSDQALHSSGAGSYMHRNISVPVDPIHAALL